MRSTILQYSVYNRYVYMFAIISNERQQVKMRKKKTSLPRPASLATKFVLAKKSQQNPLTGIAKSDRIQRVKRNRLHVQANRWQ